MATYKSHTLMLLVRIKAGPFLKEIKHWNKFMNNNLKIRLQDFYNDSTILLDHDTITGLVDLPEPKRCRVHFVTGETGYIVVVKQSANDINALICGEQLKIKKSKGQKHD